jgi:hypothetical protein
MRNLFGTSNTRLRVQPTAVVLTLAMMWFIDKAECD